MGGKEESNASTENPVPSITLSITQDDVKRVLDASKAMAETLVTIQNGTMAGTKEDVSNEDVKKSYEKSRPPAAKVVSVESANSSTEGASKVFEKKGQRPLHEMIFEAAQRCEHPMLQVFLDKMKASGSNPKEVQAGILVFHDLGMPEKIKLIFDVLGEKSSNDKSSRKDNDDSQVTLSREGALSLFRSVIVAISSCIHQDKRVQIEMEKGTVTAEPQTKKRRVEGNSPDSAKTHDNSASSDSVPALQSPSRSFDSSLGTLKEEDDFTTSSVRKEFEEIAMYATDRLVRFTQKGSSNKSDSVTITIKSFEDWRRFEGARIAPWLELLNLAKWKTPVRPSAKPLVPKKAVEPEKKEIVAESKVKEEPRSPEKKSPQKRSTPRKENESKFSPERLAPSPLYVDDNSSRTVVSFDFTGSVPDDDESAFCINITEDNLTTLRNLVLNTGLARRRTTEITDILIGASKDRVYKGGEIKVIPIERFHTCLHQLLGSGSQKRLSKIDKDVFSSCFVDFFSCFDTRELPLEEGEVDAKELCVGFCFLCAGNKSTKLAAGFELLESERSAGLTTNQLAQYLRSYLTMLCGISLLTSSSDGVMKPKLNNARRRAMIAAVENGSRWTMSHFLKTSGNSKEDIHSFEAFANWYTDGGYNVAPWLELLDLKKLLSLVGDSSEIGPKTPPMAQDALPPFPGPKTSTPEYMSPRRPHHTPIPAGDPFAHTPGALSAEVLFTFPLANQRSLVVLKEDATYVRKVVDQLGLLSLSPDEIWPSLHSIALKHPPVPPRRGVKTPKNGTSGKNMLVNKATFVDCMQELIESKTGSRKRSSSGVSKAISDARDVLVNFFHSFDLLQVDRVALNELMGGLSLLCGGKKSTKLAFAFGVFDQRPPRKAKKGKKTSSVVNSLGGEDLFLFLRSFLIVMFSCCRQSWDLSDDSVNRYIADTANMVTDDVMRYQWRTGKKDRVDFDEFGQWYNEGGFETAPWLELLDLKKWVLVESFDSLEAHKTPPTPQNDIDCPPPPPDDSVDPSFFDDDAHAIMPMDSIDEMDILLMQPSQDKENDSELNKLARSFSYSPGNKSRSSSKNSNSLKFHLVTEDDHGGYVVSVSQKRIRHLRELLTESGLYRLDGEIACKQILGKAYRDEKSGRYCMTKDDFDSAMRGLIASRNMALESQRALSAILGEIFAAFDYSGTGIVSATEVACGFTVFCKGKKSDKLEYAFEVLDRDRRGNLSQSDTAKYLRSFLTVLLNIVSTAALEADYNEDVMTTTSGMRCDKTTSTVARAVEAGSSWAAAQAFRNRRGSRDTICFDEFAEWYTHVGYSNIPWLELLDLHKWVITDA